MAAPRLRVSPSGPLAGGKNPPFNELAGNLYRRDLASTTEYVGKVGPSDAGAVFAPSVALSGGGALNPPDNNIVLGLGNDDPITFSPGQWLVEAVISVGFATASPSADTAADLNLSFSFQEEDGTLVGTPVVVAASPIPRSGVGTFGGQVVHTTNVKFVVDISQEDFEANDNQGFAAWRLTATRATGSVNGAYTTTSGWLEFTKDTNVKISRIR